MPGRALELGNKPIQCKITHLTLIYEDGNDGRNMILLPLVLKEDPLFPHLHPRSAHSPAPQPPPTSAVFSISLGFQISTLECRKEPEAPEFPYVIIRRRLRCMV